MSEPDPQAGQHAAPLLRVVSPEATAEELAALVAVLSALGAGGAPEPRRTRPEWSAPARAVRRPLPHGAGAWRSSSLPR